MVIVTVQHGAPEVTYYPYGNGWIADGDSGNLDIFREDKCIGTHVDGSWTSVAIASEVRP